ncbi:MAG: hypothetical protein WCC84_02285 [Candidatus Cybelea sp.]
MRLAIRFVLGAAAATLLALPAVAALPAQSHSITPAKPRVPPAASEVRREFKPRPPMHPMSVSHPSPLAHPSHPPQPSLTLDWQTVTEYSP